MMIKYIFFVAAAISSTVAIAQMPDPKSALSYTDAVGCYANAVWQISSCQNIKALEKFCPVASEAMGSSKSLAYDKGASLGKDITKVNQDLRAATLSLTSELLATNGVARDELTKAIGAKFFRECAGKGLVSETTLRSLR